MVLDIVWWRLKINSVDVWTINVTHNNSQHFVWEQMCCVSKFMCECRMGIVVGWRSINSDYSKEITSSIHTISGQYMRSSETTVLMSEIKSDSKLEWIEINGKQLDTSTHAPPPRPCVLSDLKTLIRPCGSSRSSVMPLCNQDSVIVIMWALLLYIMKCQSAIKFLKLIALIKVPLISESTLFVAIVAISLKLLNWTESPTECRLKATGRRASLVGR